MTPDIDTVTRLIEEAAAEHVLPYFKALNDSDVREKTGPNDLVTQADLDCEAFLTKALTGLLPSARVLGEEAAHKTPALIEALDGDTPVWIIDPVDGTYNFAHGDNRFCIIVGLAHKGKMLAGWIHSPVEGYTVTGETGGGAYRDGVRQSVAAAAPLERMNAVLYVGAQRAPSLHARLKAVKDQLGPRSYQRCAGAEHLELIQGRVHYAIFTKQMPWDHAAGYLMHKEAGGYARLMNGQPYHPRGSDFPLLLAPDRDSWHNLNEFFDGPRALAPVAPAA
jgi:fructose-1,6-bisphosphatase/inositol monophosphatase family enzyme